MVFELSSKEAVGAGLGSIAAAEIDRVVSVTGELDVRVHEARKTIKRLRALLRLFRAGLDDREYRRSDAVLESAGRSLGGFRDNTVIGQTLEALVDSVTGDERALLSSRMHSLLATLRKDETSGRSNASAALASVHGVLGEFRQRRKLAAVARDGWRLVGPGFRRVYSRGRRALRRAERHASESRLHTLRKFVKRHQYHLELLEPAWPKPLRAVRHEVSTLGELLGSDHDLSVLERRLREGDSLATDATLSSVLTRVVNVRHGELRRRAFELSTRVYAESPDRHAARHRAYFEAWT